MIRRIAGKICITTVFLSFACLANAQEQDLWQWNTFNLEKKISPKFSLALAEEFRLFHNISQVNLLYTNIGGSYKITNYLKTALTYRYLLKRQDDATYSFRHRFYADVSVRKKIKVLAFSYRARLQTQFRDVNSSENGRVPESYWRNKFEVKLDINKSLTPYIAAEFRYQLGNVHQKEGNYLWDRGRYYVGFEYQLNKKNSLGAYYMLQWEYNVNDPERDQVIGLEYNLTI